MAGKLEPISLDGLLGSGFWEGVDPNVKQNVANAVVQVLGQSGALTDAQAGLLRAQRDAVALGVENGKLRQAGVRPGQYLSQRQRDEILHPEDRKTRMQRLQFHGGVANGRWVNNFDEWKNAGNLQHKNAEGEEIQTRSFGFQDWRPKPLPSEVAGLNGTKGAPKSVVKDMWKGSKGDFRSVRRDLNGDLVYTFGGDGNRADVRARAIRRMKVLTKEHEIKEQEKAKGNLGPPIDWFKYFGYEPRASFKGGAAMRERGWLDAIFAKAERAAMRGGRSRR